MLDLPVGAELEDFGKGLDPWTLRVRCGGLIYLVFQQCVNWAALLAIPHILTDGFLDEPGEFSFVGGG